jgi:hypothetical protein
LPTTLVLYGRQVSAIRTKEAHAETALRKNQNHRKKTAHCSNGKNQKPRKPETPKHLHRPQKLTIAEKLTEQEGKT